MNQKLVEGDITPDTYKVLYKKFHAAIPQAWMYTLCCKNLERFWRDGENFEKEEYLPEDKCQGISELQICLSNANSLIEESKEVILDEDVVLKRRTKKKDLCKRCLWFGVLMSILDTAIENLYQTPFY